MSNDKEKVAKMVKTGEFRIEGGPAVDKDGKPIARTWTEELHVTTMEPARRGAVVRLIEKIKRI